MASPSRRRWPYVIAAGAFVALLAAAYTPARRFHRFFLTPCAADGPVPETELDIDVEPVDLVPFYEELRVAAGGLTFREIARASHGGREWPIYLIGSETSPANAATLVIAGVHGNEVSGSLAARTILETMRDRRPEAAPIQLVVPANPVGLAHGSRYNAQGCDINRDFASFRTVEARAIRSAIEHVRPRLVVAMHEGPQDGVFVIGTRITPGALLASLALDLENAGIPLATENNLGIALSTPGVMSEGSFITAAKSWLGISTLGEHTSALGIPLVTIEVPWGWPNLEARIEAQARLVRVASRQTR